jgi:hypothetical protein
MPKNVQLATRRRVKRIVARDLVWPVLRPQSLKKRRKEEEEEEVLTITITMTTGPFLSCPRVFLHPHRPMWVLEAGR